MKRLYESLKIGNLIGKFLTDKETEEESVELKKLLEQKENGNDLFNSISNKKKIIDSIDEFEKYDNKKGWEIFIESISKQSRKKIFFRWKVAASIIIIVTFSSLTFNYFSEKKIDTIEISEQILPGEPKAFIELSNGTKFDLQNLDEQQQKKLAQETGIVVKDNIVKYSETGHHLKDAPEFLTLVVPRGGEYQLILSDGTKVWLNAESSLKYPNKFTANNRLVKLTGEAYFSVAKDSNRPFVVNLQNMDIEVLGTEFNVSAYNNDNFIKTTLVEGNVLIKNNSNPASKNQTLSQGEQLSFDKKNNTTEVNKVNVYEYIAWKDGRFVFEHRTLEEITKILGRWYDVDFVFKSDDIKNSYFFGEFLRYENISTVKEILNMTGAQIEFKQIDRTIEISKK